VRERYRLGQRPVALTVATNLPHKNLPILFEAMALIAPEQRPTLVLAGHGTDREALRASASTAGVSDDVRGLGGLSTGALEDLYTLAACLVLPTLHEGFGLPVLEAMARGVPVVCSDIAALREIAGEAALYFDPRSASQIAARLGEVLASPDLAERLREGGIGRAERFSWQAAAEGTLACYRRVLSASAPTGQDLPQLRRKDPQRQQERSEDHGGDRP
jgi:glycosyltransferase involved in cell wall biosynthesis